MANHEYETASSPLAQLVLIKSPYLQLPHPITLPYNYTPLPNSVDTIVYPSPLILLITAHDRLLPSRCLRRVISQEDHRPQIRTRITRRKDQDVGGTNPSARGPGEETDSAGIP
jgi:hypothetical protein